MHMKGRTPKSDDEPWRRDLGVRVKALRRSADLTVRELAEESGLSMRFLAEVEGGRANPSLSSLHDLARALAVDVVDLLRQEAPPPPRPIALLGLRGAGKSTVGAKVAKGL